MENNHTVLFDFDGVIADSFTAAFSTSKARCRHRTEEGYRKAFEGNIYTADIDRESDDHSACNHDLDWWNTFSAFFSENGGLFEHMDTVVKDLAKSYRLVIVSSSMHHIIDTFLKEHNLSDCFDGIYDAALHKSKSEKIGMIFGQFGIDPRDCIMITDSKGDILEAREKGVESLCVTWGFNSKEVLVSGEPWRIVELPLELPNAVTEFFHGKGTAA
jgi:phosphoglycolate phosphatase